MTNDPNLPALIDRIQGRLEIARTSAEALEIRGIADSLLHRAKLVKASNRVHADLLRIISRAERLIGQNLIEAKERGEIAGEGRPKKLSNTTTVSELNITRDQSAYFQQLARTPQEVVHRAINRVLEEGRRPLKSDVKAALKGVISRPRRKRGKTFSKRDIVDDYKVKEYGGWLLAATNKFWNKVSWDDEVNIEKTPGVVVGPITVTRERDSKDIIIRIPGEIHPHVLNDPNINDEFRLTKVKVDED
jgi:hypothetical protein